MLYSNAIFRVIIESLIICIHFINKPLQYLSLERISKRIIGTSKYSWKEREMECSVYPRSQTHMLALYYHTSIY